MGRIRFLSEEEVKLLRGLIGREIRVWHPIKAGYKTEWSKSQGTLLNVVGDWICLDTPGEYATEGVFIRLSSTTQIEVVRPVEEKPLPDPILDYRTGRDQEENLPGKLPPGAAFPARCPTCNGTWYLYDPGYYFCRVCGWCSSHALLHTDGHEEALPNCPEPRWDKVVIGGCSHGVNYGDSCEECDDIIARGE